MEKIIKKLMKNILGGIFLTILILGIIYLIGLLEQFILNHYWLMIPLSLLVILILFKEICGEVDNNGRKKNLGKR